ncbi:MAG: LptF/LptG family permease, partial [Nitrospinota bacterium]
MNILCRYIFKEYLRVYLLTATTLLSVFIIVSLFEILADALEHKAGPALLGKYLLMKVPQAAYFMAPLIVLISSILCLGMLSKSNEIVAMRAAGLGISSITAPIFFIATLSSFFMLVMGELVLPYANIEMKRVHKEEIKKQVRPGVQQKNNFWYRTDSGSILKIDVVSETGKILRNVTLLSFKENRLWQRIESKNVVWEDSKWKAEESWFRFFDKEGSFISEFHQAIELPLGEQPSDFTVIRKSPDKMSYQEIGD